MFLVLFTQCRKSLKNLEQTEACKFFCRFSVLDGVLAGKQNLNGNLC